MGNFFSKNLKYIREQKKLSQNKLAEMVGVNQTTIARWEDDNRTPNLDNAIDVSQALNIPLPDLIGRDLENNTSSLPTTNEEYKRILREKGLMDNNDFINEEKLDKLLKAVDMIENFNTKE